VNETEAIQTMTTGGRVEGFSACNPDLLMVRGDLIGYQDKPSVVIRTADGHVESWALHLTRPAAPGQPDIGIDRQCAWRVTGPVVMVNADNADDARRIAEAFADVERLQAEVRRVIEERDEALQRDSAAAQDRDMALEQLAQRDTEITKRRERNLELRAKVALLTNERDQALRDSRNADRLTDPTPAGYWYRQFFEANDGFIEMRDERDSAIRERDEAIRKVDQLRTELRVATDRPAPAEKAVDLLTELIGLVENPIRARELDNWFSDIANISDRALTLIGASECKETAEPAWAVCGAKKFDGRNRVLFECTETGPHDRHRDRAVSWPA